MLWDVDEGPFDAYCSFIAGGGRVLAVTQGGQLCLFKAAKNGFACIATLDLFDDLPDTERDVWSHLALVGNRLYVRNMLGVYCFLMHY